MTSKTNRYLDPKTKILWFLPGNRVFEKSLKRCGRLLGEYLINDSERDYLADVRENFIRTPFWVVGEEEPCAGRVSGKQSEKIGEIYDRHYR